MLDVETELLVVLEVELLELEFDTWLLVSVLVVFDVVVFMFVSLLLLLLLVVVVVSDLLACVELFVEYW